MTLDEQIVHRLHSNGFEVYIVGGAVRDWLLDINCRDVDYATNARPHELKKLFPDKKFNLVGADFKVLMVDNTEIATFRKDIQHIMFDARECKPEYADTIEEDLNRRDLTINAMAIEPISGRLIDIHGGVSDLEKGIIRFVGDPKKRIDEDPVRILRAARFFASFGTTIAYSSFEAMCEKAHYVTKYFRPDKIRKDLMKAMELETPSIFFSCLQTVGVLKYLLPQLDACFNHPGGPNHKETVWEHCMLAGDNIHPKFPILRLAAFLHDIGKPLAYDSKKSSFICHEDIGAGLVRKYTKNLKFSNDDQAKLVGLVKSHMRVCANLTPKGQRRLAKHLGDSNIDPRDFLRLKLADRKANLARDPNRISPIKNMVKKCGIRNMEPVPLTTNDIAIKGGQLIEVLDLEPGPIVGILQNALLDYVVDSVEEGVNSYEHLLQKAREFLEEINA